MALTPDIKLGASLYSFQEEYFLRTITLEGAIEVCSTIGALGIETLAEQMMPGFPSLTDGFYKQWHAWMDKYGTTPTAHDMFLDTKRYKNRLMSDEEMIESVQRDIIHAEKLGAFVIRVIVNTPPHIVEASADFARKHNVKLAVEVHSPWTFEHEWIQSHIAVADRVGRDVVGIIPDLGIFVRRFPRVISERIVRDGATPEIAKLVTDTYDSDGDLDALQEDVVRRGGNAEDRRLAEMVKHFIHEDPQDLVTYMPYIKHIHGKFYEMTDEEVEYSIPYEEIFSALKAGGYQGYVSSEYEGNRHIQDAFAVDSTQQVTRHQNMMRRYLDAI